MQIDYNPVQFFTAVCYNWLHLLADDESKLIVIEALRFRTKIGQVRVGVFVIMPNHIHIIWRVQNGFRLRDVQRDFLKFIARELIAKLQRDSGDAGLDPLYVDLKDRKFLVWKRNSLSVDLFTDRFLEQKLQYIHANPCQPHWQLASHPANYRFSSARFYETGIDEFDFIQHIDDI